MMSVYWVGMMAVMAGICVADPNNNTSREEPKILILGAGMSGVTVAKTLDDAGHHNFLLIEGSSRIGGRMKSTQLSGYTVELGAMWVYGTGTNPIYKLLVDNDISMNEDYADTMTVRNSTGSNVTEMASDVQSQFDEAIESFDVDSKEALAKDLPDFTVASSLRYHNWHPKTAIDDVIESYNCDFEFGVSPAYLSGKYAYWWAPYETFDSEDSPIVNDPRGFETLVERLGLNFSQDSDRIKFNEVVTQINQDQDGVEVLTSSGSRYTGDIVVVTFSLGVLQNKGVAFGPELPDCKRHAIDGFGMTSLNQIYLKFPSAFWDDTTYVLYASEERGKYSIWVNMNIVQPGSNILQLSVWNEECRRIERLDDQTIVDDILHHLRRIYPNQVIPTPENYKISRWTYDTLTYGAYSYWPTGFTRANMADMMAPFGRVYFAGEHLDPEQYSYVHAAHASGLKTGADILKCVQDPDYCQTTNGYKCSQTGSENGCVSGAGLVLQFSNLQSYGWQLFLIVLAGLLADIC